MKFEDLLTDINGFGRFQMMIICISFIGRFTLPCHFLLSNFISATPSHHCNISHLDTDGIFGNLTQEERLTVSIPTQEDGTPASCHMFSHPQFHLLSNSSSTTDLPVQCQHGWEYDNSTFISTLATQFDLVCDNRGLNKAAATVFFVGAMFGAILFGDLSDRFGRKPMLLVSYVSGMGFAVASAFSSSFIMFAVLRFFTGLTITGIITISSVLNVEWVDIQHRRLVRVIDSIGWTFGITGLSLIAFYVRDWRWLTVAVTSPVLLSTILWWWVPESARWLIVHGKTQKAHYYLHRCAVINRREHISSSIQPEVLSTIIVTDTGKRMFSYLDLIRTPKMRRLSLFTGTIWFCVATATYGISLNITGFGLNIYMTQFVYGAIEIPAKLSIYYLLEKIGRRRTSTVTLLLAGISLMINIFMPSDQWVGRTVVAVLGKGFSAAAFATIVLYSSELYPTVLRQNGLGYNSFLGRLGVAVAPMVLLLDSVWGYLPQITLCSVALLGSFVAWQLPETSGRCLPETIEDIEGTEKNLIKHYEKTG